MRISDKNSVLDDLDIEILNQLNSDSSVANSRLAEIVGLAELFSYLCDGKMK